MVSDTIIGFSSLIFNGGIVLLAILFIWLIIKFLKVWWLKYILLGVVIGFVVLTIPIALLLVWFSCRNVPDCGMLQAYIGAIISPIIGAIVGFIIGLRKQNNQAISQ